MYVFLIITCLVLQGCFSVTDFVKANDLLDQKLLPYKQAIEELAKRQEVANQVIMSIDEKAGTKVLTKK